MIKLLTVNIEGARHYERILTLVNKEQPDVLCLQELPSGFVGKLAEIGYFTTYAPMLVGNTIAPDDCIGIGIATKQPTNATVTYYAGNTGTIRPYERANCAETISNPVIMCPYRATDGRTYTIATAHQPVTRSGTTDATQETATTNLLAFLATQPAHILCGDMNMPRGYNTTTNDFARSTRMKFQHTIRVASTPHCIVPKVTPMPTNLFLTSTWLIIFSRNQPTAWKT